MPLDRGQRQDDDLGVEDDLEVGDTQQDQRFPSARIWFVDPPGS
jgi:hypothetical protein